eukprot:TRINITY_DN106379_c0_g1_i1.p1 TRINITY_DN106379_c0_g1~~TRINITY_DN106379_c0_g1_i1.p1  ORF type:complete len:495 (-),score=85.69 TRINITY_DN106379_c0_g1_i1:47-1531(-)
MLESLPSRARFFGVTGCAARDPSVQCRRIRRQTLLAGLCIALCVIVAETAAWPSAARFVMSPQALLVMPRLLKVARQQAGPTATGCKRVQPLAPEDAWIASVDVEAFGAEVHALGQRLLKEERGPGKAHFEHLQQMVMWSDILAVLGLSTMWLPPNPFTVLALGLWSHSRFTMVGHHSMHGGHNVIDPTGRYHRNTFGSRSLVRRIVDWFDWFLPEAWGAEHDQHHFHLSEDDDPDVVENMSRTWQGAPKKWIMTLLTLLIWKWGYIAPQTYKELKVKEWQRAGRPLPEGFDRHAPMTLLEAFRKDGRNVFRASELVCDVILPYLVLHFIILPLPLVLLDPSLELLWNAEIHLLLADFLSNFLLFACVATNHAGSDMYRFQRACRPWSPTFYLRAVCASVNFEHGGPVSNFLHGFTNHQIEHHCWPHLSMLSLSRGAGELKAICKHHGVPYVQENVWIRLRKTIDIMTERSCMRWFPAGWEREADLLPYKASRT